MLQIINNSSLILLGIIGTFLVFRLQWLRGELDDYRGRIIFLVTRDKNEANREKDKTILQNLVNNQVMNRDQMLEKSDKNFKKYIEDLKNSTSNLLELSDDKGITTVGGSFSLFKKRLSQKENLLIFMCLSVAVLMVFFWASTIYVSAIISSCVGGILTYCYLSVVTSIIIFLLYFLANDY